MAAIAMVKAAPPSFFVRALPNLFCSDSIVRMRFQSRQRKAYPRAARFEVINGVIDTQM
jgi:hypothetical protein